MHTHEYLRWVPDDGLTSPEGHEQASKASPASRILQAATKSALAEKPHSIRTNFACLLRFSADTWPHSGQERLVFWGGTAISAPRARSINAKPISHKSTENCAPPSLRKSSSPTPNRRPLRRSRILNCSLRMTGARDVFVNVILNPPAPNAAARRRQKLSVPRLPGYSQLRRFRVREPVKTTAPLRMECSDRAETVLDINAHRLYPLRAMASGRWSACVHAREPAGH